VALTASAVFHLRLHVCLCLLICLCVRVCMLVIFIAIMWPVAKCGAFCLLRIVCTFTVF